MPDGSIRLCEVRGGSGRANTGFCVSARDYIAPQITPYLPSWWTESAVMAKANDDLQAEYNAAKRVVNV